MTNFPLGFGPEAIDKHPGNLTGLTDTLAHFLHLDSVTINRRFTQPVFMAFCFQDGIYFCRGLKLGDAGIAQQLLQLFKDDGRQPGYG